VFALVALSVARIAPVVLSLTGTTIAPRDRLVLGWLGPRGVATLVFGLLAVVELHGPETDLVLAVTVVTIVASIVVHGLSTGLVIRSYARRAPS
jgi:sodium/hydrogen antiporter